MSDNRKPGLEVIFGIGKPKAGHDMSMPMSERGSPRDGPEYPPGFEDAAEAAFDALEAKDSKEFCRALCDAITAIAESEESEPPEEEAREEEL
jgi:hypothetical protein